jgi:hypothetical protein
MLLRFGIRRWSFTEQNNGRSVPVPIRGDSIELLLPFGTVGYEVTNRAMGLYLGDLMRPLAARRNKRLGFGRTGGTTSRTPASGPKPRSSRSRSSRRSTAGPTSEVPAP